jgi:hypothetical protein
MFCFNFSLRSYVTEASAREIRQGRGGDVGNPPPNDWASRHDVPVLPGYQAGGAFITSTLPTLNPSHIVSLQSDGTGHQASLECISPPRLLISTTGSY